MNGKSLYPALLSIALLTSPSAHAVEQTSAVDIWNDAKLEMIYLLDLELNPFDIVVEVHNGTAYLAGTLPSLEQKTRAERLALQIDGVEKVQNDIVLDKNIPQNQARYEGAVQAVSDANIAAMIRTQLSWDRLTEGVAITVSVQNGTATLNGSVPDKQIQQEAVRIAENTRLVNRVNNKLVVNP